jgi:hypothetical protein
MTLIKTLMNMHLKRLQELQSLHEIVFLQCHLL